MSRCHCLGASHGPSCPLLDAFDYEAEERECQRIEAALRFDAALKRAREIERAHRDGELARGDA